MRPGPEVLASFGASADPVSLPGGEGTAWRAGEVVLKRRDPDPSAGLETVARTGEPVTVLVLARLALG